MLECGLDHSGSEDGHVSCFLEHDNGPAHSIKCWKCLYEPSKLYFFEDIFHEGA